MAIKYSKLKAGDYAGVINRPVPFRRLLKQILKNFYRGDISGDEISAWLEKLGLWGGPEHIRLILRTNLKGGLITRLGRAALKKGGRLRLVDLYRKHLTWGGCVIRSRASNNEFHTIPFVKRVKKIEVKFVDTWERLDGSFMAFVPVVTREYCVRYEQGVEPAVEIHR